jgi:hypothetical protein
MGFYIRKSLRAGPFRFNLSKSGVGVSAGVPGFRVGSGPRGNYVYVGRGGVYYRSTLGGRRRTASAPLAPPPPAWTPPASPEVVLEDMTGATAAELLSAAPDDLVPTQRGSEADPAMANCCCLHDRARGGAPSNRRGRDRSGWSGN